MLAEVEPTELIQCENPGCNVAADGKCIEGNALDKCQYYGKPPRPLVDARTSFQQPSGIQLPNGELLSIVDANAVLRGGASRVIAIVGPKEAGKTTLIASIFELFLRGPIGPFRFCSSRTLFAFERACHPSRAESQNVVPKMERTLLTDVRFYHLATRRGDGSAVNILLADRNGEDYGDAPDEPSTTTNFAEISRGDVITFLVDGEQLLHLVSRASITAQVVAIAQALLDGGAMEHRPQAALVLTKVDKIQKSADAERAMRDFASLVTRFRARFGVNFAEIRDFVVAAFPSDVSLPLGHGVQPLLDYWEHQPSRMLDPVRRYVPQSERYMDRLR